MLSRSPLVTSRACRLVIGVALCGLLFPARATAFTFVFTGDGSNQTLTRLTESCVNFQQANSFSSNGRIPLTLLGGGSLMGGGMLDWVGQSRSLKVVAMPVSRAVGTSGTSCAGAWGAVDVRTVPLTFQIAPEVGDPFPLIVSLQIVPKLLGTSEQFTNPGCTSYLWLQLSMAVAVDGQVVTRDSLWMDAHALSDGADEYVPLSFPKGGSNSKVVPNITPSSEITFTIWAYMRGLVYGSGSIDAFSSYGDGPAIEILVRDASSVAVPEPDDPTRLELAAHPNPSPGATRMHYSLPRTTHVRLSIYDLHGARVATLVDRVQEAGRHDLAWSDRDAGGERLAAGVYLMELTAGRERTVGKLVLLGR